MARNWVKALAEVSDLKNYEIRFYEGGSVMANAQTAAKVKYAILNDIRCFEVADSLYATKSVSAVERRREIERAECLNDSLDYDLSEPPREQKEAMELFYQAISMNSYFTGEALNSDFPNLLSGYSKSLTQLK